MQAAPKPVGLPSVIVVPVKVRVFAVTMFSASHGPLVNVSRLNCQLVLSIRSSACGGEAGGVAEIDHVGDLAVAQAGDLDRGVGRGER